LDFAFFAKNNFFIKYQQISIKRK